MKAKMILRNIISIPVGVVAFFLALTITTLIEGLLLKVPFLVSLLSWQSTPTLYLASITLLASGEISLLTSNAVCEENDSGRKIGYIIFACIMGAYYFFGAIFELFSGWKDTIPGMFLTAGLFIIMFIEGLHGEN